MSTFYAGQLDYIAKLNGMVDGSVVHTKVTIDDANFNLDIVSSNPRITFDSGDYMEWNRASNFLYLPGGNIGLSMTPVARVDMTSLVNNFASAMGVVDTACIRVVNTGTGNLNNAAKLHLDIGQIGRATVSGYYAAFNGSGDIGVGLAFGTQATLGGGTVERMRIDHLGNVGIGATPTWGLLHVAGAIGAGNYYIGGQATTDAGTIGFGNGNGPGLILYGSASGGGGAFLINTAGSTRVKVTSGGVIELGGDANFNLQLSSGNPYFGLDSGDYWLFNRASNSFVVVVGNAARHELGNGFVTTYNAGVVRHWFSDTSKGANLKNGFIELNTQAFYFYKVNDDFASGIAELGRVDGAGGFRSPNATGAAVADTVHFYSSDDAAGHTIPSFYCEGTNVVATGQADSASSVRVKMRINGTVRTFLCI